MADAAGEGGDEYLGVGDGEGAFDFGAGEAEAFVGGLAGGFGEHAEGEVVGVGVGADAGDAVGGDGGFAEGLEAAGEPGFDVFGAGVGDAGAAGFLGGAGGGWAVVDGVDDGAEVDFVAGVEGAVDGEGVRFLGERGAGEAVPVAGDGGLDHQGELGLSEIDGPGREDAHLRAGVAAAIVHPAREAAHDGPVHVLGVDQGLGGEGMPGIQGEQGLCGDEPGCPVGCGVHWMMSHSPAC
ncbi:hypothetical protein GCM10010232_56760 [Streptomyces amakusaensis]